MKGKKAYLYKKNKMYLINYLSKSMVLNTYNPSQLV